MAKNTTDKIFEKFFTVKYHLTKLKLYFTEGFLFYLVSEKREKLVGSLEIRTPKC